MLVLFEGEDLEHTCEVTKDEWDRLTAFARKRGYPIDGATVDSDLLEVLLRRRHQGKKPRNRVARVVRLV